MQLSVDAGLLEINLHVAGGDNLLGFGVGVESDSNQTIAGQQPGPVSGGTAFDALRNHTLFRVDPLDAIPGRRFLLDTLAKVEDAGAD